jgi:hypothetical protein
MQLMGDLEYEALLKMVKLEVKKLKRAYAGKK